jgi:hypothetical protein
VPWSISHVTTGLRPELYCDNCGQQVDGDGFVTWPVDWHTEAPAPAVVLVAHSEECVESLAEVRVDQGEWIATPISVYLANLVDGLGIDVGKVLEIERASIAAERTRDQSPD